jgi:hypothetical protein
MIDHLRDLMDHSEWANAVFFHVWDKSPARDHEEMRRRVGHVVGVQDGFLSVLGGEAAGRPPDGLRRLSMRSRPGPSRAMPGCGFLLARSIPRR